MHGLYYETGWHAFGAVYSEQMQQMGAGRSRLPSVQSLVFIPRLKALGFFDVDNRFRRAIPLAGATLDAQIRIYIGLRFALADCVAFAPNHACAT
jgi:hypothetical protein